MKYVKIVRHRNGKEEEIQDIVIEERYIDLYVKDAFIDSIVYSPPNEDELIFGYLFLYGYLNEREDLKDILYEAIGDHINCHVSIKNIEKENILPNKKFELDYDKFIELMNEVLSKSKIFRQTGGTHISGLSDGEEILSCFEDVSRRSTIYKVVGDAVLKRKIYEATLLFTSGRINSTAVQYAKKAGIKAILSHSAPTDLAIKKAREFNITLIGFLRNNRFNIYTTI